MKNFTSLTTFFADRLRHAWQRHCEIIRLQYELDATSDRALAEMGMSRGDIADVASGRFARD